MSALNNFIILIGWFMTIGLITAGLLMLSLTLDGDIEEVFSNE